MRVNTDVDHLEKYPETTRETRSFLVFTEKVFVEMMRGWTGLSWWIKGRKERLYYVYWRKSGQEIPRTLNWLPPRFRNPCIHLCHFQYSHLVHA
uniref:MBD domain-containing protein n=1 Tax=Ascaris lumbricoides TaxID=6252 RepID=A0A0M3I8F0_ASCLU